MTYEERDAAKSLLEKHPIPKEGIGCFAKRLKEALNGESARSFSRRCGLSEGAVRSYMGGGSYPTLDRLHQVAVAAGVEAQWLAFGKKEQAPAMDDYALVPLYDAQCSAGAGAWNESCEVLTHLSFTRYSLRRQGLTPEHLSAIRVDGESMEPVLHSGDTVLIDHTRTTIEGEGIYIVRLDGHLYAKRLQRQFDGVAIISANPIYNQVIVPRDRLDELEIIGRAVWAAGWL